MAARSLRVGQLQPESASSTCSRPRRSRTGNRRERRARGRPSGVTDGDAQIERDHLSFYQCHPGRKGRKPLDEGGCQVVRVSLGEYDGEVVARRQPPRGVQSTRPSS